VVQKLLLKKKASMDKTNKGGWTPLIHAAHMGHLECVKILLDHVKASDDNEGEQEVSMHKAVESRTKVADLSTALLLSLLTRTCFGGGAANPH